MDFLSDRFNIKVIAPHRNKANRNKSASDMLVHIRNPKEKVILQEHLLEERRKFLDNWVGPVLDVSFEELVSKDLATFVRLKKFLEYKGPVEDLMAPVDAGRVKFNG